MKLALILLAICGLVAAQYSVTVDLKSPIERIQKQILVTEQKPADWEQLPEIITKLLECLQGLIPSYKVVSDAVPSPIKNYIESLTPKSFAKELIKLDWKQVKEAAVTGQNEIQGLWEDLEKFMATEKFETIHNHIWGDEEFLDLIKFIHDSNYPEIYETIRKFYDDMKRQDLELPSAPDSNPINQRRTRRSVPSTNLPNWFPLVKQQAPIISEDCNLLVELPALLVQLETSNIHEVLKALLYGAQEVIGSSGIHVLLLKLGEHQKGEFIRSTLELEEMKEGLPLLQGLIFSEPSVAQLNNILKQLTGLDMLNQELFKYVVELLQYLVWGIPFP